MWYAYTVYIMGIIYRYWCMYILYILYKIERVIILTMAVLQWCEGIGDVDVSMKMGCMRYKVEYT